MNDVDAAETVIRPIMRLGISRTEIPSAESEKAMNNEELYDKAMEAITDLFSDKSVSQSEARRNLESLIGEIEAMIDTLEESDE